MSEFPDTMGERETSRDPITRRELVKGASSAALLATFGGMGLAACGGSSGNPAKTGTTSGTPKRGGTLRVGVPGGGSTETLDPENPEADPAIARVNQLCDTLMAYTPDLKLEYALAESAVPSHNATVWTVRLRDGVEFHDGRPLTAADVIYTLRRILNKKSPGAGAARLSTLDASRLKALDKRTVHLPFHAPFSPLLQVLADAGTAGVRIVPEGFDVRHPVGTGPFKYQSFSPGVQSEFVRNENYWREGQPYVDKVVILDLNDDNARSNALIGGQVDAIEQLPNSEISTVSSNPNLRVLNSVTGGWNPFTMRTDVAPFDDVRVRQAFRLIADRPGLVKSVLQGYGTIANDLYGRYDPAYNHGLPQREQDIERARSLLKQAGREGLAVQLVTSNVALGLVQSAQVFAQQASAAGVKVNILTTTPTTFFSRYFLNASLSQTYWAARGFLVQAADSMLPNAVYNETHWHNVRWLKLVKEAFATVAGARQTELIHEAQSIEWNEGGYLNWGWYNEIDAYSARVHGLVPDRSALALSSYRFRELWID